MSNKRTDKTKIDHQIQPLVEEKGLPPVKQSKPMPQVKEPKQEKTKK